MPQEMHAPPFVSHAEADGVVQVVPVQQPVAHVVELQPVHTPPLHTSPPQPAHAAPPDPHWLAVLPASQVPPMPTVVQQPAQDVESQTHWPEEQRWPLAQGGLVPHMHWPEALHVSVAPVHDEHEPPPVPHVAAELVWQVFPSQQPLGQLVASHAHDPLVHSWPLAHSPPLPQAHVPIDEQPFARVPSHFTHAFPPAPQFVNVGISHVVPLQQPPAQDVALHTQLPIEQTCPELHGGEVPHMHTPVTEQLSA
jgi:hypothetical protein